MNKIFYCFFFLGLTFPAEFGQYELIYIGPIILRLFDIFIMISVLYILFHIKFYFVEGNNLSNPLFQLILLYFFWGIFSGVFFGALSFGYRSFGEARINTWSVLIFFLIILIINSKYDLLKLVKLVFVSQIILMTIALAKTITSSDDLERIMNSAEAFSLYAIVISVLFVLSTQLYNEKKLKVFVGIASIFLVISGQKTIWMLFVFGLLMYLFIEKKFIAFYKLIPALILVGFITYIVVSKVSNLQTVLEYQYSLLQEGEEGHTIVWRALMWKASIEKIKQNPILGEGYGGYNEDVIINDKFNVTPIHSAYFDKMVKIGIPGLILFILIMLKFLLESRRFLKASTNTYYNSIMKGCIVIILSYILFFVTYGETFLFWIVVAVGYKILNEKNNAAFYPLIESYSAKLIRI